MFCEVCYCRDLVAFTWNIATLESCEEITRMLAATLPATKPSHWAIAGEATEAGGVTEAWFTFETAVARGKGLLRLKDDKAWTMLTTMVELKGHEEPHGAHRPKGVEHGVHRNRKSWLESKAQEEAELGYA